MSRESTHFPTTSERVGKCAGPPARAEAGALMRGQAGVADSTARTSSSVDRNVRPAIARCA